MSYSDWQQYFKRLLEIKKIDQMLEFGLGEGTKLLLDNCGHVTSYEILSKATELEWFDKCKEDYKDYKNWTLLLHQAETDYFDEDIKKRILEFLDGKHFDAAFVDPGVAYRPEITNLLFGKIDIIFVHDTSQGMDVYNWTRLDHPSDYHVSQFTSGEGVTFWFKDKDLAERMGGEPTGWIATIE